MKTEIIKELRYALRSGRILILLACFMFFALLTPVMLKTVLPMVLSAQLTGETAQGFSGLETAPNSVEIENDSSK